MKIDTDCAPPWSVQVSKAPGGEKVIEVISEFHVLARIECAGKMGMAIARLIVNAVNKAPRK